MGMKNNATRQMHFRPQVLFWSARGWDDGPPAATPLYFLCPDLIIKARIKLALPCRFWTGLRGHLLTQWVLSAGRRPCPAPERCCVVSAWSWFRAVRVAWGTQDWLVCPEPGLMFRGTPCCVLEPRPALGALKLLGEQSGVSLIGLYCGSRHGDDLWALWLNPSRIKKHVNGWLWKFFWICLSFIFISSSNSVSLKPADFSHLEFDNLCFYLANWLNFSPHGGFKKVILQGQIAKRLGVWPREQIKMRSKWKVITQAGLRDFRVCRRWIGDRRAKWLVAKL